MDFIWRVQCYLFSFVPVYLAVIFRFSADVKDFRERHWRHIVIAAALFVLMTLLVNGFILPHRRDMQSPVTWHTASGLATFPLTIIPHPALFHFCRESKCVTSGQTPETFTGLLLIMSCRGILCGNNLPGGCTTKCRYQWFSLKTSVR